MNLEYTKDELNTLKLYKDQYYEAINQLLISNCETDLAILSDVKEKELLYFEQLLIEHY